MVNKPKVFNTKKLFIFNLAYFFRFLIGEQVLPVLVVLSLSFIVTALFPPFYFLILALVYKFAFDVLYDMAQGNMKTLVSHNYLVTNMIVLKVVLVGVLIEGVKIWFDYSVLNYNYKLLYIVLSTFVTPAIYMVLALTNSLFSALNPIILLKVIKTDFITYSVFVLFWFSTQILVDLVINPLAYYYITDFINGIVASFFTFSILILNFRIMGYIIFQNRTAFNLETLGFNKIDGDEIIIQTDVDNPVHQRIKHLIADDEPGQALAMILELQKDGDSSLELQRLYKLAMDRKLYSASNKDTAQKIHRRLKQKQFRNAFKILTDHLETGEVYVEESAADINQLVEYAMQSGNNKYIARLVKDFHTKYPYHPDIVTNYFILAKSLYNNRETRKDCKKILQGLINKYPQDKSIMEIQSWLKGLELMTKKEH